MTREREHLINVVFPRVQRIAASKVAGARVVPVDLRWGVSADEEPITKSGGPARQADATLSVAICLFELARCHSVVCMLGWRYGWHRGAEFKAHVATASRQRGMAWVAGVAGAGGVSVTELEVRQSLRLGIPLHVFARTDVPKAGSEEEETLLKWIKADDTCGDDDNDDGGGGGGKDCVGSMAI